jgi:hypothetical protein
MLSNSRENRSVRVAEAYIHHHRLKPIVPCPDLFAFGQLIDRLQRIAAASINPTALLDELRKAVAVLTDDNLSQPAPTKRRPVLRLIEGGLST